MLKSISHYQKLTMHYFKPFRPFIVLIFLCTQMLTWGQSFELQAEQLAKMSFKQDIPYFKDSTDFESLYQYLKDLESSSFAENYESSSCLDEFPFLESFEKTKSFQSLHTKQMLNECEALELGVAPESLPESFIPDPILASLFNKKGQIWIDETIIYFAAANRVFVIEKNDLNGLKEIEAGTYQNNPNINLYLGGEEAKADFDYSIISDYVLQFEFTGILSAGQYVQWEIEGMTYNTLETLHNFGAAGTYTACISILADENGETITIDKLCKEIVLEDQVTCPFYIKKNEQANGLVCFQLLSLGADQAISYNWNFGDGNTSNSSAPCHTYPCSSNYLVQVSGKTQSGCTYNENLNLKLNSFECCDYFASKTNQVYYEDYMLKITLKQLPLPIIGRTIVSTRVYKKKGNKYKKTKAWIKNSITGVVFTKDQGGCKCMNPIEMDKTEIKYKKWLSTHYTVGDFFQAKKDQPWTGRVYINGQLKYNGQVNVNCD